MKPVSGPLRDPRQARTFLDRYIWPRIEPELAAGRRLRVTVQDEKRSLEQNAKFHALCSDIAESDVTWAGKRRTAAEWKVLLVPGRAVVTKDGHDIVPGLEGEFVNLRESTAQMGVRRGASLIEYTLAFMATNGIPVRGPWEDAC